MIDELLAEHPLDEAVTILNGRGLTGGWGRPFSTPSLMALCRNHNIPTLEQRLRAGGMLTAHEIAEQFGGGGHTKAAGASLDLTLAEAQDRVLDAARQVLRPVAATPS